MSGMSAGRVGETRPHVCHEGGTATQIMSASRSDHEVLQPRPPRLLGPKQTATQRLEGRAGGSPARRGSCFLAWTRLFTCKLTAPIKRRDADDARGAVAS